MIPCRTAIRRLSKVRGDLASRGTSMHRHLSTKSSPSNPESESKPLSLYCWGTNDKGSIPTKEILEEGKSGGAGGASNLLNRGGAIIDHPMKIDLGDAFGTCVIPFCISQFLCFFSEDLFDSVQILLLLPYQAMTKFLCVMLSVVQHPLLFFRRKIPYTILERINLGNSGRETKMMF